MNNDEMIIYIPLTWPVETRVDLESKIQRAASQEKLVLTETGTTYNAAQQMQMRAMYFAMAKDARMEAGNDR